MSNTLANLADSLRRWYPEEFFTCHLNVAAPFFTEIVKGSKVKGWKQDGDGVYWPFFLQSPQNIGTPGETGALPVSSARNEPQGRVRLGQFIGRFDISFLFQTISESDKSGWGSGVKRAVKENTQDLTKHVNRLFAGTHGTGRIGQVNVATSASTSFVGKLPFGVLLMRPKMQIAIYDDDTGSGSAENTAVGITKIVQATRTVTTDTSMTLDADDHIYINGSYGQTTVPNGIDGLIDDGTNLTTMHNLSRNTYEELKSVRLSNSGNPRDLSESLLLEGAHTVRQRSGRQIDCLLMNTGQFSKYLSGVRQDRIFSVTGKGVPAYDTGYKADSPYKPQAQFYHGGTTADIYVSEDVKPRTVYGITKSELRRLEQGPMDWMDWGGGNMFQQAVSSGSYITAKTATLAYFANIATTCPSAHFVAVDLSDKELCGSAVGGSDT